MRKAERLFDIIQILRGRSQPITAAELATTLEVAPRTIYRDIISLQASRVPIEGAAGLGYVLRRGYDLPPLMFTQDEVDAIAVGARLVHRLRDPALQNAADRVLAKIAAVLPAPLRPHLAEPPVFISEGNAREATAIDLGTIRAALRDRRKLRIAYTAADGTPTRRTIWPIALAYYVDVTLLAAWCELREAIRHFRLERITATETLPARFPADGGKRFADWLALEKYRT